MPTRRLSRAIAAIALACSAAVGAPAAGASSPLPNDPNANGRLGFCDQHGNPITHGSVNDEPFVWLAVSSKAAAAPYNKDGKSATMFAYQPRPDVPPGDWSGEFMTATSRYTDANHPMAAGTAGDPSLATFDSDFPLMVNGLVVLRLYLSAPDTQPLTRQYSTATVQVKGSTWTLVDGGNVPCNTGTATSIESIYLSPSDITAPPSSPKTSTPTGAGASSSGSGAGSTSVEPSSRGSSTSSSSGAGAKTASNSDQGNGTLAWWCAAAVLALGGGSAVWYARRRRVIGADADHDAPDDGQQ